MGPSPTGGDKEEAHQRQVVEAGAKDQDHQEKAKTVCLRWSLPELIGPHLHEKVESNL